MGIFFFFFFLSFFASSSNFIDRFSLSFSGRKQFQKVLTKQGLKFKTGTKVLSAEKTNGKLQVHVESAKGGNQETVNADS